MPSAGLWLFLWHLVAPIAIGFGAATMRLGSPWPAESRQQLFFVLYFATYFIAAAIIAGLMRRFGATNPLIAALVAAACFMSFLAALVLGEFWVPRSILVILAPAFFALLAIPLFVGRNPLRLGVVAGSCVVLVSLLLGETGNDVAVQGPRDASRVIATNHVNLLATFHHDYFDSVQATGGGLDRMGDRMILASGDGGLFLLDQETKSNRLNVTPLAHGVPMNRDGFLRAAARDPRVIAGWFRVTDVLVQPQDSVFNLYVAHHHWDDSLSCATVRISVAREVSPAELSSPRPVPWETLFDTYPCLGFKNTVRPFAGHQDGGRLALLSSTQLLLSLGDHEYDGVNAEPMFPQEDTVAFGKTIAVDVETGASEVYSTGHRNSQGLTVTRAGDVWLTEHGPKGGDELNLIVKGRNYGWPLVTYGTVYDLGIWPPNERQGRHTGFEKPFFAWVPSVGISNLIYVEDDHIEEWKGDLLIATLADASLLRVRIEENRVRFIEPIVLGERIRDIATDAFGRLVLWTESRPASPISAGIIVIEPIRNDSRFDLAAIPDAEVRGEILFARCAACHASSGTESHDIGPNLNGVVGRRIASWGPFEYSESMQKLGGRWTAERLDDFLASPQEFAPGTSMQFAGVSDAAEREALIAFLSRRRD